MSKTDHVEVGELVKRVLRRAYRDGFTVQCDFARNNSVYVAAAASLQLITTLCDDTYGRRWRITAKGLRWLNETKED